jgi:hypothetical protein
MMFVLFNSNTTGVTSRAGTASPVGTCGMSLVEQELLVLSEHAGSPPVCSWVRAAQSLVICFV